MRPSTTSCRFLAEITKHCIWKDYSDTKLKHVRTHSPHWDTIMKKKGVWEREKALQCGSEYIQKGVNIWIEGWAQLWINTPAAIIVLMHCEAASAQCSDTCFVNS